MAGEHLRTGHRPRARSVAVVVASLFVGLALGIGITSVVERADRDGGSVAVDAGDGVATAAPDPGPITLAFVGDIYAEHSLADRLDTDPDGFVGPFSTALRDADLAIGNVEAAITGRGAALDKEFAFRASPSIVDALVSGGIDVLSVANDHALDFGPEGLAETLTLESEGAPLIGVGRNEDEAYAPFVREVGGHRIAVIAATQVIDADRISDWTAQDDSAGVASAKRSDRLVEEVEDVRSEADTVVVFLHWGTEAEDCPNRNQQELAETLVEAGADVVVGSHAHRLQGAGRLGDGFVGYGLGNFLFGAVDDATARTGVLTVEVDGRQVLGYEWVPGEIVDRVPQPLEGEAATTAADEWEALRECTDLTP
jgi:poly-gamma-glutamate capsule biosynthesis protein CapA/YwtB (metallophosphatase superfamily)